MNPFREISHTLKAAALAAAVLMPVMGLTPPAKAQLQVDITRGTVEPLPIAIPEFFGKTPQEIETGRNIADLISADLERSGLFRPIDRRAFIQQVSALQGQSQLLGWFVSIHDMPHQMVLRGQDLDTCIQSLGYENGWTSKIQS